MPVLHYSLIPFHNFRERTRSRIRFYITAIIQWDFGRKTTRKDVHLITREPYRAEGRTKIYDSALLSGFFVAGLLFSVRYKVCLGIPGWADGIPVMVSRGFSTN